MKRKAIKIVFALSVLVSSVGLQPLLTHATEAESMIISIDSYASVFQNECEKYDVKYELRGYDPNVLITKDMFDQDFAELKEILNAYEDRRETADKIFTGEAKTMPEVSAYLMPETKTYNSYATVQNDLGAAQLQINTNMTVNIQNATLISLNSVDSFPSGYNTNFDGWTQTSYKWNYGGGIIPVQNQIIVSVTGQLSTSHTSIITGVKNGLITSETCSVTVGF